MALTYSPAGEPGWTAVDFRLPGIDGKTYSLSDFEGAKALVVIFMCNHCPYVRAVQDRISALAREYEAQGVRVVGINSNDARQYPDDSPEHMREQARKHGFIFPYLVDESQQVARSYGAVCTPDFFVFSPAAGTAGEKFKLSYRGRLDDSWKNASQVTRRELAAALDEILAGREPSREQHSSMGCSIKWK